MDCSPRAYRPGTPLPHAGKTVQVTVGPGTYEITVAAGMAVTAARAGSRDIRRHKASNYGG